MVLSAAQFKLQLDIFLPLSVGASLIVFHIFLCMSILLPAASVCTQLKLQLDNFLPLSLGAWLTAFCISSYIRMFMNPPTSCFCPCMFHYGSCQFDLAQSWLQEERCFSAVGLILESYHLLGMGYFIVFSSEATSLVTHTHYHRHKDNYLFMSCCSFPELVAVLYCCCLV